MPINNPQISSWLVCAFKCNLELPTAPIKKAVIDMLKSKYYCKDTYRYKFSY